MTNNNQTNITILLDRSGSMSDIRDDTTGGFNSFLTDQKELPEGATLTLVQFDNEYEVNYTDIPLQMVKDLDTKTYQPRGSTALLDALGRSIINLGNRLENIQEEERPEKVTFVVITDGYENASREFTKSKIAEMIKHQKEKYSWNFIFLGANMDAVREGTSYNMDGGKTLTFQATGDGIRKSFGSLSTSVKKYRKVVGANLAASESDFTDEDREENKDD